MIAAIEADREPVLNGEEARKAVELVLAIHRAAQTGEPVALPLVPLL